MHFLFQLKKARSHYKNYNLNINLNSTNDIKILKNNINLRNINRQVHKNITYVSGKNLPKYMHKDV